MVKIWNDLTGDIVNKKTDKVGFHVKTMNRFCERNNAETKVNKNVKRQQHNNLEAYKKVKKAITELYEKDFEINVKNILEHLNITIWTKGDKINEILGIMVCTGYLKKYQKPYIKQNGETGKKYVFSVVSREQVKMCPYLQEGKCTFIWNRGRLEDKK